MPDILMVLVSCFGFEKFNKTVILTCYSALISYYLSKGFFIVEKKGVLDKAPIRVKKRIN